MYNCQHITYELVTHYTRNMLFIYPMCRLLERCVTVPIWGVWWCWYALPEKHPPHLQRWIPSHPNPLAVIGPPSRQTQHAGPSANSKRRSSIPNFKSLNWNNTSSLRPVPVSFHFVFIQRAGQKTAWQTWCDAVPHFPISFIQPPQLWLWVWPRGEQDLNLPYRDG